MKAYSAVALEAQASRAALKQPDERTLVLEAQNGSRVAFEELVRRYDQGVLRLAINLVRSAEDAKDIYQEAFLRVYRNLGRFRFECSLYTWIYRIVTNVCLDHLRRKNLRKEDTAPATNEGDGEGANLFDQIRETRAEANPERDLMRRQLAWGIQEALNELSARERMVFEMRHYQGMKLRIIGEMFGTSEETIKNCLFRAHQKLRVRLREWM
jgi:RNA polymerase sigma-70 factor (ECF subfamily)